MTRHRLTLLGALAAMLAGPAMAQAPADRLRLQRFRDSLTTVTSEPDLLRLRETLRRQVRSGTDDVALLRLGHVWLRLADVTGNVAGYGAAASAFEEVSERQPDWPFAWDGLAAATYGEHVSASAVLTALVDMFGGVPHQRLARHYLRGAEADSTHVAGVRDLAMAAVTSTDETLRGVALAAVRLAAELPVGANREVRLARARLERDDAELDSALVQLEALVDAEPAAPDALLELARLRFMMGRVDGLDPWYRGLAAADSTVYAAYRRDLALVFPDTSIDRLDAATSSDRPTIAQREWQRQDPDGLPVVGDRLRDHYRRLEFARRHYRRRAFVPGPDPLAWVGVLDARGEVYVRYGSPAIRTSLGRHGGPEVEATLRIVGAPPNETWRYGPPDERALLFHFVVREPGGDFTQAESALDILALTRQYRMFRTEDVPAGVALDSLPPPIQTYGAELVSMVAQELLLSRTRAHPVYDQLVREGKGGAEALQLAERAIGRASADSDPRWSLQYELPLEAEVTVLAVGQAGGQPQVQVGFAIAGSALLPIRTARGVGYQVRMRAAIRDAAGEVVASVDTLRGFLTGAVLRPNDHLLGHLAIPVPAGEYTVRVALEADGLGMLSRRQILRVPSPATSTLAISDLALGTRRVRLPWATATADTAWINPLRAFRLTEPLELYFEVLGIPAGTEYRVDVAVIRVSGRSELSEDTERVMAAGGRPALTLGFDQRHPGGVAGVAREVALSRLEPGEYVLEVVVSTDGGARTVRRQPFLVTR